MRSAPTVPPNTAPPVPATPPSGADGVEFNIWRSGRILGLEVIDTNSHKHSYPAHMHDALEIIWIRSGVGQLKCQSASFEIQEGEAMVIPPNELHGGGGSGSVLKYVAIALPKVLIDRIFPDFKFLVDGQGRPVPAKLVSREKANSLLPIMVTTLCADLPAEQLLFILRPILHQLLDVPLDLSAAIRDRSELHPAVSKVQSILRDQCADRMQVSELAESVDLDMRYLISLFKIATGVTPHQFQIAMRVELARALLEQHLPLCEVAARAGFADQSHLNRHFRRHYGFTPGEFRESVTRRSSIVV
jgi:AraC-like DNA-binding protein/mannose-6-phosphate isomerase-like protein (cupin superfamily)